MGRQQVGLVARGEHHPVRLDAEQFGPFEVGDDDNLRPRQLVEVVELFDAGDDLARLDADVDGELRQLVGSLDPLGALDPADAEVEFLELLDRKSTRLNSSHSGESRMPSSA